MADDQVQVQLILALEMLVQRALGQVQCHGQRIQGHPGFAVFQQQLLCHFKDLRLTRTKLGLTIHQRCSPV